MHHNIYKLGIIAGSGNLPKHLISYCKERNLEYYLVGIKNNYKSSNKNYNLPDIFLSFGKIGNFFSLFKKNNVSHVVLIGAIKKPSLFQIIPNLITLKYILKILLVYRKGDNQLLSKILSIIEKEGYKVIGANSLLSKFLAPYGLLTNNLNHKYTKVMYKKLINRAKLFGKLDQGQSLVFYKEEVIAKEDHNGTDSMILNVSKLRLNGLVLVKASKPNQDTRVDLPTIGENTIINAKNAGIIGIVIETNKTFIANYKKTIELANKADIFIYSENA